MPYEIKVSEQLISIRLFGVVAPEDLSNYTEELGQIEAGHAVTLDRLTDLTETVESYMDVEPVHAMAARRTQATIRNPIRSAIVAPTALQYGFSRMFQTLNENPLIEIEIFRDLPTAMAWLSSGNRDS